MLLSFPVAYLAMSLLPLQWTALAAAVLIGTIPLYAEPSPPLWIAMLGLAGLFAVIKRVVYISGRNFNQKQANDELLLNTVLSFAKTIDARDPYTAFHSNNVANYAKSIAEEMRLPRQQIQSIYLAGLIHDIGKIGTPETILQKEGRLTDEEFETMKRHAEDGYEIVKGMKALRDIGVPDMVRHHHERIDGRGYPLALKGDEIPLGARILGVADAFDAMTTNRSYRAKLSVETAASELERHKGTQFDPAAAEAFLAVLRREGKLAPAADDSYAPALVMAASR
ncbi:HD-GYP domain-containing protein [Paenibacillus chartarius]|uniref:HD-GYP domain-containing protein n=1 Tax=Paenibacillus chartarius TaxID=747481 RepID=A0ABV6DQK9_9BACL